MYPRGYTDINNGNTVGCKTVEQLSQRRCGSSAAAEHLSVYLAVADNATLPRGWGRQAKYSLTVHNQKDPSLTVVRGARSHPRHDLGLHPTDPLATHRCEQSL